MLAPGAERGVAAMLTATSWVLQRLPGQVVEEQRGELIRTLAALQNLVVEVECSARRCWCDPGERVITVAAGRQRGRGRNPPRDRGRPGAPLAELTLRYQLRRPLNERCGEKATRYGNRPSTIAATTCAR